MEIQERGKMPLERDDYLEVSGVRLPPIAKSMVAVEEQDDFKKSSEELLSLSGLSNNFKKNVKRKLAKSLITAGGEIVEAEGNIVSRIHVAFCFNYFSTGSN